VDMWNWHRIRSSQNTTAPTGRPMVMYTSPVLWGGVDQLCGVSDTDITVCCSEAVFRSSMPCDPDVYEACLHIMHRDRLEFHVNDNTGLYLILRTELRRLVQ